jgi:hypothetical protein
LTSALPSVAEKQRGGEENSALDVQRRRRRRGAGAHTVPTMTPTHTGIDLGWIARPAFRRSLWTALAVVAAIVTSAILLIANGSGTTCVGLSHLTRGPDVRVTALPGVDLRPMLGLSGLSAASGPYPGVTSSLGHGGTEVSTWIEGRPARRSAVDRPFLVSGSWPRRGGVVVEQGLARRLDLRAGQRTRVATTQGTRSLRVTGIAASSSVARTADAPGLAYVLPQDLRRVAPASVHGSTVLLSVNDADTGVLARWLEQRYPGPQAVIARSFSDRCLTH